MTTQALPGPQPPPRLTAIAVALTIDVAVACKGESQKRGFLPNAPATSPEEDAPSRDREDLGHGYGPVLPPRPRSSSPAAPMTSFRAGVVSVAVVLAGDPGFDGLSF